MKYGLIKVAAAIPGVRVADVNYNVEQIESLIAQAEGRGVELIVFPELSLTGYTSQDLFRLQMLTDKAEEGLLKLLDFTRKLDIISVVGLPVRIGSLLCNCAAVVQRGCLLGIVAKTYLPNYNEFYEKRWFASAADLQEQDFYIAGTPVHMSSEPQIFRTCDGVSFGVEICEDVWAPLPPSNNLALAGADIVVNLSATDELIGKHDYLRSLLAQQSARMICGYVYASCGFGESTQDVVYGGNAMIFENGRCLAEGRRFDVDAQMQIQQIDVERLRLERQNNTTFRTAQVGAQARVVETKLVEPRDFEFLRQVSPHPFIPQGAQMGASCEEILNIQTMGLCKRLQHTHCDKAVIGISGGLDSTLALLVVVRAFDKLELSRKGIIGITMPGFGTTDRTHDNAVSLMQTLGITQREISIAKAVTQHFEDIGHDGQRHDVAYENSQARERTQILMDVANQVGGRVIGTGDLSELALGWCTYNGDHMSMYAVNSGVPKTLVQYLIRYAAQLPDFEPQRATLMDVVDTPISPELTPADADGNIAQKTEDLVGPYELHDFFLYYHLRAGFRPSKIFMLAQHAFGGKYDDETIKKWLTTFFRRFFSQQFKRSCLPDGPKVGSVSLSPRGDWRMPSDASCALWLKECAELCHRRA
ncbi:MAG: NAD(+) synthase [Prevotella sp.]|nr:NAD(+) synthase [Prevotella sp.]